MLTNVVAVIQARMGSTRLPGKIMMDVENRPMLWHVVDRLGRCNMLNKVVVATSDRRSDDAVEKFCEKHSFNIFRGDENNVLARYYSAAEKYAADVVVRITGDCPLIDPELVDTCIHSFLVDYFDYYSNINPPTFPDGLDCEVIKYSALETAYKSARLKSEIEHVTPFIRNNPALFKIGNCSSAINYEYHRWTLDNKEDFELIEKIYSRLYSVGKYVAWTDVIRLLEENPEWLKINSSNNRNEGFIKSLKNDSFIN